jgi:site-specific DNA-methyltransferase (adenine-specific)
MSRHSPGEVRDSVLNYLSTRDSATVGEIRSAVTDDLGDPVPASSVRSYLRLNEGKTLYKHARGQYSLLPAPPDAPPEPIEPAASWGNVRLFQGDCLDFLRNQPLNSFHAVVTDPPYGLVEYSSTEIAKLRRGVGGVWRIPPSFDGHVRSPLPRFTTLNKNDLGDIETFFTQWGNALYPTLVPGAHVLVASNPLLSFIVSGALARGGFERRGELVRLVMTMRGGDRPKNAHEEFADVTVMPRSMWEPWLVFRKPMHGRVQDNLRQWKTGGFRRPSAERPFGDVIVSRPASPRERKLAPHPSLKPQDFLRQLVRAVLPLGDGVIIDPFAGSGSTLAAAIAVGYDAVGVELDPVYVEMAKSAVPALAQMGAPVRVVSSPGRPSSPGAS